MTVIKDVSLAGRTIDYNGVQFGGADSDQSMLPPEYSLSGSFVYDDAGRQVTHTDYSLTVRTVILQSSEQAQSSQVDDINRLLNEPGKTLKLAGLGAGFSTDPSDIVWGPKPRTISLEPIGGQLAWELVWQVNFGYFPQRSLASPGALTWMAFNFDNVWSNDFEGQAKRTMTGYVQIAQPVQGKKQTGNTVAQVRRKITHLVPDGFKVTGSTFRESLDKSRIDFTFAIEQFNAEAYPPGITNATGIYGMEATGAALVKGSASIGMTLTTAPGVPKKRALEVFLVAALAKQRHLQSLQAGGSLAGGQRQSAVIPSNLRVSHQLWSRTTSLSMTWTVTGGVRAVIADGHIWQPVPGSNFRQWKNSVQHLWDNEGNAGLTAQPREDILIDLGDKTSQATIGRGPNRADPVTPTALRPTLAPPEEATSYNTYLVWDEVIRDDHITVHRLATSLTPDPDERPRDPLNKEPQGIGLANFQQKSDDFNVPERSGYPEIQIIRRWQIARTGFKPVIPELKNWGGTPVRLLDGRPIQPYRIGNAGRHAVWYTTGWKRYLVLQDQPKRAQDVDDPIAEAEGGGDQQRFSDFRDMLPRAHTSLTIDTGRSLFVTQ